MSHYLCPNPSCAHDEAAVLNIRWTEADRAIRRWRECARCHTRFLTTERLEHLLPPPHKHQPVDAPSS
jgi:transcriptional regulator NrdR family protein